MSDLESMRTFVAVVDEGSFSSAARRLGLTPSAVSKQMAALEANLDARLFNRTTRSLNLTEAGEIYFKRVNRVVEDADAARDAVRDLNTSPTGVLRVSTSIDLALALLEPLLPAFTRHYPGIELRITTGTTDVDLTNGSVDVVLRMGHSSDSSLMIRRLGPSRSNLYASPDYLAQHGVPYHPADLTQHACLCFRSTADPVHWSFRVDQNAFAVPIRGPLRVDSLQFLLGAATRGQGIAMLPQWVVRPYAKVGQLQQVLAGFPLDPESTPVQLVYADRRHLAEKISCFVDFIAEHIALT